MTNVQTNLKNPICLLPKSLQIGLDDQVVINGQCGWVDFIGVDTIALITSQNDVCKARRDQRCRSNRPI